MTITEERLLGRAKNSVLTFFERRISIPKIYLDATWDGVELDVLAIDRDGIGDVHAALLFTRRYFADGLLDIARDAEMVSQLIERFDSIPANFKYIVAVDANRPLPANLFRVSEPLKERLFASNGIGRIGLLHVTEEADDTLETNYVLKAERFRAVIAKLADSYVQEHNADWEIRA
jgi:hypothetical protein